MLNEANALCRRWKAPYSFSRKEALEEALETAVCVHDHQRRVMMKWNVDTMKRKLDAMRQAAEDGLPFPADRIFDGDAGDQWQVEVDHFVATSIRERLEQIQKRQAAAEFSFSVTLDESRFSLDSSPQYVPHSLIFIHPFFLFKAISYLDGSCFSLHFQIFFVSPFLLFLFS